MVTISHLTLTGTTTKITSGLAGLAITINGTGFSLNSIVLVNNQTISAKNISGSQITFSMPSGFTNSTVPIIVKDNTNSSTPVYFTYTSPACTFPIGQQNVPPTRETTLCFTPNKQNTLTYTQHRTKQTKNQQWSYLSNLQKVTQVCRLPIQSICATKQCVSNGITIRRQNQLDQFIGCTDIIGDITINEFIGQPDFNVFACLKTISGTFYIGNNNRGLIRISGFNSLQTIGGSFNILSLTVTGQRPLISITGFNSLQTVGGFFGISNTGITSLSGFNSLQTVGGFFGILSNTNLNSLSGFTALTSIGEDAEITGGTPERPTILTICSSTDTKISNAVSPPYTYTKINNIIINPLC
jgi:hypothetical protein